MVYCRWYMCAMPSVCISVCVVLAGVCTFGGREKGRFTVCKKRPSTDGNVMVTNDTISDAVLSPVYTDAAQLNWTSF